ncbi:hypothetical protein [Paenibacillus sp. E194]|uniref:hypothetical protein n=1 Tax=Paenibacillus sp. E194 TaxID=1458845 RepID=UPI0005CACCDF|nr:hypothetical protein [Paenibacillus sp. E194]
MNSKLASLDCIPWQRMTTAYGRGTDIPQLIEEGQYHELANLIEHQGTLWQVTPWVMLVLLQKLADRARQPDQITENEMTPYAAVASALAFQDMEAGQAVDKMEDLLEEKYLWPESEEEDEEQWEEGEPLGYDPIPFFSYYYYSYDILKQAVPTFTAIKNGNRQLAPTIDEILQLFAS